MVVPSWLGCMPPWTGLTLKDLLFSFWRCWRKKLPSSHSLTPSLKAQMNKMLCKNWVCLSICNLNHKTTILYTFTTLQYLLTSFAFHTSYPCESPRGLTGLCSGSSPALPPSSLGSWTDCRAGGNAFLMTTGWLCHSPVTLTAHFPPHHQSV